MLHYTIVTIAYIIFYCCYYLLWILHQHVSSARKPHLQHSKLTRGSIFFIKNSKLDITNPLYIRLTTVYTLSISKIYQREEREKENRIHSDAYIHFTCYYTYINTQNLWKILRRTVRCVAPETKKLFAREDEGRRDEKTYVDLNVYVGSPQAHPSVLCVRTRTRSQQAPATWYTVCRMGDICAVARMYYAS